MSWIIAIIAAILVAVVGVLAVAALRTRSIARATAAAFPRTGRVVAVPGGSIHAVETGDPAKPPLVLIHGLAANHMCFYRLSPLLERDFHVIAIDRPGSGHSTRNDDALAALTEQARMIAAFLDAERIVRPVIVGHSLGGAVALTLALDRPDKAGALALLAPLTHPEPGPAGVFKGLAVGSPRMRRLVGHTLAVPVAKRMAQASLAAVFAPDPVPADFQTAGGGGFGLRPEGFIAPSADFMHAGVCMEELSARYGALKAPGGVLFGSEDRILSPDRHAAPLVAAAPQLVDERLAGRGHMIPVTAPEECADFIRRMAARREG